MALIRAHTASAAPDNRQTAAERLTLLQGLEAGDSATRRTAARELVSFSDVGVALVDRLRREQDPSVRDVILTTVTRLGDPTAIAGLIECLRSEDAALRNGAIEAMQSLPEAVAPMMHQLLADADPDVRIFAVNVLALLRHPQVETWLIDLIEHDPHVNVCAAAVDVLSDVGTRAASSALLQLGKRFPDEPYVQFAVALTLGRVDEN